MQKLTSFSDQSDEAVVKKAPWWGHFRHTQLAARASVLAGVAFTAGGITQIVHSQRHSGNRVVGVAGYVALSCFVVALIAAAPSFIALARRARSGVAAKAGLAAAAGTAVLGLTSITSLVNGHDLGLFNVVAPLTNAAWLFGSIVLAVSLKRAGRVPTALAVGLPVAWVAAVPLATVGGGVVVGAYYIALGHVLSSEPLPSIARPVAQPARS